MHVRWERRITSTKRNITQYQLVALLVEGCLSEENENAKVLTRLAAIEERFLLIRISKTRAFHQGLFWVKVDQKLQKLSLEEEVQQALEAQISKKVPRPGDDWALWGVTCIPQIDC